MKMVAICLLMALPLGSPGMAAAQTGRCAAPGDVAMREKRFRDAAREFDVAARDPSCVSERERLVFNSAFALHQLARESRDVRWCTARDAYLRLSDAEDAEIRAAASNGAQLAGETCDVFSRGRREGLNDPVTHQWWLYRAGGGLAFLGVILLVSGSHDLNDTDPEIRGKAKGLMVSGGALVGGGLATAAVGWVWSLWQDDQQADFPAKGAAGLTITSRGFSLSGTF